MPVLAKPPGFSLPSVLGTRISTSKARVAGSIAGLIRETSPSNGCVIGRGEHLGLLADAHFADAPLGHAAAEFERVLDHQPEQLGAFHHVFAFGDACGGDGVLDVAVAAGNRLAGRRHADQRVFSCCSAIASASCFTRMAAMPALASNIWLSYSACATRDSDSPLGQLFLGRGSLGDQRFGALEPRLRVVALQSGLHHGRNLRHVGAGRGQLGQSQLGQLDLQFLLRLAHGELIVGRVDLEQHLAGLDAVGHVVRDALRRGRLPWRRWTFLHSRAACPTTPT